MEGLYQGSVLVYTLLHAVSSLSLTCYFVYQLCAHGTTVYVFSVIE